MADAFERAAVKTARGWGSACAARLRIGVGNDAREGDPDAASSASAGSRDARGGRHRPLARTSSGRPLTAPRRRPRADGARADDAADPDAPSTASSSARGGDGGFRLVGRFGARHRFASLSAGLNPPIGDDDAASTATESDAADVSTSSAASSPSSGNVADQGIIGETVVYVEDDKDTGLTRVSLITSDRNNLMADIGSAFGSMGMSVQYAEMRAGADGFVETTFVVAGPDLGPIKWEDWDKVKSRLKASCSKRGRGRPWQERESRLRELFSRIDSVGKGYIAQEDLDMFAQSLRMPRAFVYDFVDEGDQSGTGKMSFEEFAAFVRSKEISLQASYDTLEPDEKGLIKGARLKKNLKNLEIRAGRYNSRKKIRAKGIERMLKYVDDEAVLTASDFRDMMILIPSGQLETVSPYYMKVGLDIGTRRLPIPDRRKDGSPWGHLLAGGVAGIASKTVSSPLNVVAVRSIARGDGGANSIGEIFRRMGVIAKTEGVRGLFKGNTANSVSSAPGKAIDFFAYAAYKNALTGNGDREPTNLERLLAGSLAGMTSDTILYPLEVVSTRVTMSGSEYSGGLARAVMHIVKKEGIRGLYAGWGSAMVGVVPYAGVSFGCYDILSAQYRKAMNVDSAGPIPTLCIGFFSGFLASTVSFPLYSATVKLQTGAAIPGLVGKKTMMNVIRTTMAQGGGARALFDGWFPSAMKIVPQAGTSFAVYEVIKRRLDKKNYEVDEEVEEREEETR